MSGKHTVTVNQSTSFREGDVLAVHGGMKVRVLSVRNGQLLVGPATLLQRLRFWLLQHVYEPVRSRYGALRYRFLMWRHELGPDDMRDDHEGWNG